MIFLNFLLTNTKSGIIMNLQLREIKERALPIQSPVQKSRKGGTDHRKRKVALEGFPDRFFRDGDHGRIKKTKRWTEDQREYSDMIPVPEGLWRTDTRKSDRERKIEREVWSNGQ